MSGIYFHIPFCNKACPYCNFHFSTSLKTKDPLLDAIHKELKIRKDYPGKEEIQTIYFGGGTPSLLTPDELELLLSGTFKQFPISRNPEITVEINPDGISLDYLKQLQTLGFNRLSIGVQSFYNQDLNYLGRIHNRQQAQKTILNAQKAGFENITIDLIYGIPDQSVDQWCNNLQIISEFKIPHFSAYALTIETKTALSNWIRKRIVRSPDEENMRKHFEILLDFAEEQNIQHYEISNFGKKGFFSRHNLSYWEQKPYLGLGPSAHSYNGKSRQWNISNNPLYIKKINNNKPPWKTEQLSLADQFNEYLLTRLRTMWGCNKNVILEKFGASYLKSFEENVGSLINKEKWLNENTSTVSLTREGKAFADGIISHFFVLS